MPTFGFSAFLKLLSLNDRPQLSELRRRYKGEKKSGYDFHRSLRQKAHEFFWDGADILELIISCSEIKKDAERISAQKGLEKLASWLAEKGGSAYKVPSGIFKSPNDLFRVSFIPDFGLDIQGKKTAIHLWNTKTVGLGSNAAYTALSLFAKQYEDQFNIENLAVLSLVGAEPKLYLLENPGAYEVIADRTVASLEARIQSIIAPDRPDSHPGGPRPTA